MTSVTTGSAVTRRHKPELVKIGRRWVSKDHRWHNGLMADYIEEKAIDRWVTMGDLAKVAFGGNTVCNRDRARSKIAGLFNTLLERGKLLVRQFDERDRNYAVKLFNPADQYERKLIEKRASSELRRKERISGRLSSLLTLRARDAS